MNPRHLAGRHIDSLRLRPLLLDSRDNLSLAPLLVEFDLRNMLLHQRVQLPPESKIEL